VIKRPDDSGGSAASNGEHATVRILIELHVAACALGAVEDAELGINGVDMLRTRRDREPGRVERAVVFDVDDIRCVRERFGRSGAAKSVKRLITKPAVREEQGKTGVGGGASGEEDTAGFLPCAGCLRLKGSAALGVQVGYFGRG